MTKAPTYQGRPCKTCGGTERYACCACVHCAKTKVAKRRAEFPEREAVYWRNYSIKHASELKERDQRRSREDKVGRRRLARNYYRKNPDKALAYNKARKRRVRQATPLWIQPRDLQRIRDFYLEAQRKTKETGIQHHVDHIYPLKGKSVCGLHVPINLRVIPAEENLRKYNRA